MRSLSAPLLRSRTLGALAALLTSAFASTAQRALVPVPRGARSGSKR